MRDFDRLYKETAGDPWLHGLRGTLRYRDEVYLDVLAGAAPNGRPLRVLDIGCGNGILTAKILERLRQQGPVASFVAVDISEPALAAARERLAGAGVRFAQVGLDWTDLPSGPHDLVLAFEVLNYSAAQEVGRRLDRLRAVLAEGGRAVLSANVHAQPDDGMRLHADRLREEAERRFRVVAERRLFLNGYVDRIESQLLKLRRLPGMSMLLGATGPARAADALGRRRPEAAAVYNQVYVLE